MTIYFVPQLPVKNRYTEEWIEWFPEKFEEMGVDYKLILGDIKYPITYRKTRYNLFTDMDKAVYWELKQLEELMRISVAMREDDVIFFADLDFPGLCLPFIQLLKIKKPKVKVYGYMHAGAYCRNDIFHPVKKSKLMLERALVVVDGIFVGSKYHAQLLHNSVDVSMEKIFVVRAPFYRNYPMLYLRRTKPFAKREWDIGYVGRIDRQMNITKDLKLLCYAFPLLSFVVTHPIRGDIPPNLTVKEVTNRKEYYELLADCRMLFNFSIESTFGYSVVEALSLDVIPIAPASYSYPEIIRDKNLLYTPYKQLNPTGMKLKLWINDVRNCILYALSVREPVDKSILAECERSIDKMVEIMLGGKS